MTNKIGYVQTNGGLENWRAENNDCTVRALAIALDLPYYQAHDLLKYNGRKDGHTCRLEFIRDTLELLGLPNFAQPVNQWMTLTRLVKEQPRGVWYCVTRTHAFTVKDGILYDTWQVSGRVRIRRLVRLS